MNRNESPPTHSRFMILASVCVVVAALYFAQDVLIPLALAVLLSFLLTPMVSRLERLRVHRTLATLIVVTIGLSVIGGIGYVVYYQAMSLAEQLPTYQENIVQKFQRFRPGKSNVLNKAQEAIEKVGKELSAPTTQAATSATTNPIAANSTAANPTTANPTTGPTAGAAPSETPPAIQPDAPPGTELNPYWVFVHSQRSQFEQFQTILGPLLGPLGTAGIVMIVTIFILLGREDLRDRFIRLFGRGQLTLTTQALDDAATRISRYLMMQSIVNGTYGVVISIGLWLIGVPNPVLFGLMCGLLRFIPYVGPWIGAVLPISIALARFPGYTELVETLVLFVGVELATTNAVEPWLYGSNTGLSTIAVLVSAVFWAWLWGPVGLLLSTPLTVILVVIGKYVPQLQFIDILLGDEPVLSPPMRVYQRLLAMDQEEAMDVLRELRKTQSLEEIYDQALLPTMSMAETDSHQGQLDDRRQTFIRQSLRAIVEELGDDERTLLATKQAKQTVDAARHDAGKSSVADLANKEADNGTPGRRQLPKDCVVNVICLPAHHETDEIVNLMLAQLLEFSGYCTSTASHSALASEMIELIAKRKADVVVVSALPPAAVTYARYLCKRVHAANPDMLMAVGIWMFKGDLKKAKDRMTCVANVPLVTNLSEMMRQIHQMVQPVIVQRTGADVIAK